ncbi:protein SET [Coccinella septempunctata]|uniref:protein SET n=1 Tax=Coccinella septempunctata TaxID=41139 RepID=UPI001D060836|nr:protein SET [Coccinella septempunctata]
MSEASKKMKKECVSIEGSVSGSDLDAATQKNLEAIDICQIEIDNLSLKACEEILKIEQKFNEFKKPHFEKRSEIIKNVPNFWFTAIMNHPDLSSLIDEKEEECLQFLNRIEVIEFEDIKSGYEIQFHFEENPFFENLMIKKEFHLESGPPSSQSTQIKWKDDITKNIDQNSGKGGRKRRLESKSFFSWFFDNVDPVSDDIAEIFKDDLWLNPLQYYLVPDMDDANSAENNEDSESSSVEEK